MKINVKNFENVLKKATLNFSIETLKLDFGDKIKSSMISADSNSIAIMNNIENNVLGNNEEISFYFSDVAANVMPLLNTFSSEEVDVIIRDNYIKLVDNDQSIKIVFCDTSVPKLLGKDNVKQDVDWFFEVSIDNNFMRKFEQIKKIGARFGKVYLVIKNNEAYLLTGDLRNRFSNNLKYKLAEIEKEDLQLCFPFKSIADLFHILDIEKGFKAKFCLADDQAIGLVYVYSGDDTERYALLSVRD